MPTPLPENFVFNGDCEKFLAHAKQTGKTFDLVFTSPPYNLEKPYAGYSDDRVLEEYLDWQERIITACVERLTRTGSICWQVGNYVSNGHIVPLDLEIGPIFKKLGLKLRNRIVWNFGHGLHCKRRFSGRYEMVLWYSKTDAYKFNRGDSRALKIPTQKALHRPTKRRVLRPSSWKGFPLCPKGESTASFTCIRIKNQRVERTCPHRSLGKKDHLILEPSDAVTAIFAVD